jgi:hypothetical protein
LRRSAFFGNRRASAFRLCSGFRFSLGAGIRAWCEPGWQSLLVFVPKQTVIVVIIVARLRLPTLLPFQFHALFAILSNIFFVQVAQ